MPIFDRNSIPNTVTSSVKDPEIAEWLKTGPVLGAHQPIHVQRREHDAFIDKNPPPIGRIEYLGIAGPHGTIPVRVYHPTNVDAPASGALIYLHGAGFIVGSLDQFDTAMRRLSEGSKVQVYAVDYKLARSTSGRCRSTKANVWCDGCLSMRRNAAWTRNALRWEETPPVATRPA